MPFVNQDIPDADAEKYEIARLNKRYMSANRDWTVDRQRDIYLRQVGSGREEFHSQTTWTLYWRGELIEFELQTTAAGGLRGGAIWAHKRLLWIRIPPHLDSERGAILDVLREGLTAYKDGGVFATATSYSLTLDFGRLDPRVAGDV